MSTWVPTLSFWPKDLVYSCANILEVITLDLVKNVPNGQTDEQGNSRRN